MSVDKKLNYGAIKYGQTVPTIKSLSPKVAEIVKRTNFIKGGEVEDQKPTNVLPLTPKPDAPFNQQTNPSGWMKISSREDYYELLSPIFSEGQLKDLTIDELKELLDYYIDIRRNV